MITIFFSPIVSQPSFAFNSLFFCCSSSSSTLWMADSSLRLNSSYHYLWSHVPLMLPRNWPKFLPLDGACLLVRTDVIYQHITAIIWLWIYSFYVELHSLILSASIYTRISSISSPVSLKRQQQQHAAAAKIALNWYWDSVKEKNNRKMNTFYQQEEIDEHMAAWWSRSYYYIYMRNFRQTK